MIKKEYSPGESIECIMLNARLASAERQFRFGLISHDELLKIRAQVEYAISIIEKEKKT